MTSPGGSRLLFVYGTLKRGFSNHHLISHAPFVGECQTTDCYRLLVFGGYPALAADDECAIQGELYLVDPKTLENLDVFEGDAYFRGPVSLADGRTAEGYLLRSALLERAAPTLQTRWL